MSTSNENIVDIAFDDLMPVLMLTSKKGWEQASHVSAYSSIRDAQLLAVEKCIEIVKKHDPKNPALKELQDLHFEIQKSNFKS